MGRRHRGKTTVEQPDFHENESIASGQSESSAVTGQDPAWIRRISDGLRHLCIRTRTTFQHTILRLAEAILRLAEAIRGEYKEYEPRTYCWDLTVVFRDASDLHKFARGTFDSRSKYNMAALSWLERTNIPFTRYTEPEYIAHSFHGPIDAIGEVILEFGPPYTDDKPFTERLGELIYLRQRTFKGTFYVLEDPTVEPPKDGTAFDVCDFDLLIGSETISKHRLFEPRPPFYSTFGNRREPPLVDVTLLEAERRRKAEQVAYIELRRADAESKRIAKEAAEAAEAAARKSGEQSGNSSD